MFYNNSSRMTAQLELYKKLAQLLDSHYAFHLTGSRYYALESETLRSDWDFFIQDTPSVVEYLKVNGFVKDCASSYANDTQTVQVYSWWLDRADRSLSIQVQLVKDVVVKEAVQNLIFNDVFAEHIGKPDHPMRNKDFARHVWKTTMKSYEAGQKR